MDKRDLNRLFVTIVSNVEKKYEEECNMAIDCFIEEEYSDGELERFLMYLLDKVKDEKYEEIETKINNLLLK